MNIPKGYRLVPVEPTQEMLSECEDAGSIYNHKRGARIYRAMLAAAPILPQPIYDEAKERGLFEAWYSDDIGVAISMVQGWRRGDGYSASYERCCLSWYAWLACAQSRAKSVEVGDE